MDERGYSRPLDVHRISEYPEVQRMINSLFEEMKSAGLIGKSPRKKILEHLKVVVLDLYIAYLGDPTTYLGYSRDRNKYSKESRLGRLFLSYRPMMRVIDGLESLGYLESHKGFFDRARQAGFQSRMRASSKLIDLITNQNVVPFMVSYEWGQPLILRDSEDNDLLFPETDETRAISEQVISYNEFLSKHRIGLSLSIEEIRKVLFEKKEDPIDYSRTRLCRIFQDDFTSGGRYYNSWWQEVPAELRRYITIDGENCSELDYSSQSLALLYAFKGHEYRWLKGEGDPYAIQNAPGVDRALMKQVFITSVNAASREEAVLSIRRDINKDYRALKSTTAFIDTLIDTTTFNHPEISEYFFSSAWADLQYQDSQIAQYVLEHMQANGCVALPVHDSFVVQDRHLGQLYSLMKEAYRMLGVESIPGIKIELGAYSSDVKSNAMLSQVIRAHETVNKSELDAIKDLEDIETLE